MSLAIFVIFSSIIASIAYALGLRSNPEAKRPSAGWYGLGVLALLFAGLWASGQAGNEPAAYGFCIAISLAHPIVLLVGLASSIGRVMRTQRPITMNRFYSAPIHPRLTRLYARPPMLRMTASELRFWAARENL